ncbi:MAG: STAS domain-containing protein [bacterium]|nr:STAS domain-containing protein [bacterium]
MYEGSISVIKIRNVLLVTVPPDPDDELINQLQERVLQILDQSKAKGVIMDISTVDILDSFFAHTLVETAKMIALMGGRTIISGMNPSVAVTATQLGLTFGDIDTELDVDSALDRMEASED